METEVPFGLVYGKFIRFDILGRSADELELSDRYPLVAVEVVDNSLVRGVSFPYPGRMASLPATKTEVETIASDFPKSSTVLVGPDATETLFKMLPLQQYRVLHLALHGYLCTQNVDDLHERAGSLRVHHMHGTLFQSRCVQCNQTFPDKARSMRPPPLCRNAQSAERLSSSTWCGLGKSRWI